MNAVVRTLDDAARLEVKHAASHSTRRTPHATLDGQVLAAGTQVTLEPYRSIVLFRR